MRERKYRAWHKQEQKMYLVAGTFYQLVHLQIENTDTALAKTKAVNEKNVEIIEYTGLKDSNDREIFEGDIIKTDWGNIGPSFVGRVYWHETEFQWWITDDTKDPVSGVDYDLTFLSSYLTYNIIGNIYEHPELLGQKG